MGRVTQIIWISLVSVLFGSALPTRAQAQTPFEEAVNRSIDDGVNWLVSSQAGDGQWGDWAFEETVRYAKSKGLLVITDAK